MWIYKNKIIDTPQTIVIDGVQHPASIFTLWSKQELKTLGIKKYHPAYPTTGERIVFTETEEIKDEIYERIKTEPEPPAQDNRTYSEKRLAEYPDLEELTIALWEKVMEGRPEAAEALEARRQGIKAKYPKPNNGVDL
ncbi:MAG: hypothetical protein EBS53_00870 [Bacteroidetes bacterium]|nr:hypothetical protein [Bacteroidota bacterium]